MIAGFEEFRIRVTCPDCREVWYSSMFLREPNGEEQESMFFALCPECARNRAATSMTGFFAAIDVIPPLPEGWE